MRGILSIMDGSTISYTRSKDRNQYQVTSGDVYEWRFTTTYQNQRKSKHNKQSRKSQRLDVDVILRRQDIADARKVRVP